MTVKERWRIDAFRRAAKAMHPQPVMIIRLPLVGLCEVWSYAAGQAVVIPGRDRRSIIVCDWGTLMRFVRRHRLA